MVCVWLLRHKSDFFFVCLQVINKKIVVLAVEKEEGEEVVVISCNCKIAACDFGQLYPVGLSALRNECTALKWAALEYANRSTRFGTRLLGFDDPKFLPIRCFQANDWWID